MMVYMGGKNKHVSINLMAILASLCIILLPFAQAFAANVLLLGDDRSEGEVQTYLEGEGHTVTDGGLYYDWDGVTPNVNSFDVVVLLDGEDYSYSLDPTALTALINFVAAGGGLVLTEWCAYDVYHGYKTETFGTLMPVESPDGDYEYGGTWNVLDTGHPLVAGVPSSWTEVDTGASLVDAKPGATVLIESDEGNPLLTYWHYSCGMVVHINNDLGADEDVEMDPHTLVLIDNAVTEAADGSICSSASIPVLDDAGRMIMVVLLIGAAFWGASRYRKQAV